MVVVDGGTAVVITSSGGSYSTSPAAVVAKGVIVGSYGPAVVIWLPPSGKHNWG